MEHNLIRQKVAEIANEFEIEEVVNVSKFGNGLINDTYLVKAGRSKYVLQKLHPIFKPSVLIDTHNVTKHLLSNGLATPVLIRTKSGRLYFKDENGGHWRTLKYIPGRCYEKGVTPKQAFSAGLVVGRFHNILSDFDYEFRHKIKNFQNPGARMEKLKLTLKKFEGTEKYETTADLAGQVLKNYNRLENNIDLLPDRMTHGDLKINNIRFNHNGEAICLLDLDTLGRNKIVSDLAGAARTWCNGADEGDVKSSSFDLRVFESMLKGYLSTARFITKEEVRSVPDAVERVILVLAARFLTDAFEEEYFRLEEKRYPDLYVQNRTKATAQLNLYQDFLKKKPSAINIIKDLCKQ